MKPNPLKDHPRISFADLSGFTVDDAAARRFERRYYAWAIGGVVIILGGFVGCELLHHYSLMGDGAFAAGFVGSLLLGMTTGLWAVHRRIRALPRNIRSGEKMSPYIIKELEAQGRCEIAYVDKKSRTYFRRVYVERGS